MTQTTIETIGGKKCTVVWHKESKLCDEWIRANSGGLLLVRKTVASPYVGYDHIATALPALPRNPTQGDARLLYRYMAEGIFPVGWRTRDINKEEWQPETLHIDGVWRLYEITHCLMNGQKCDIAIINEGE